MRADEKSSPAGLGRECPRRNNSLAIGPLCPATRLPILPRRDF